MNIIIIKEICDIHKKLCFVINGGAGSENSLAVSGYKEF